MIEIRDDESLFDKPLRRSRDQRMIFGVCGGLAEWLRMDVTFVRIAFGLLALFTLWGAALAYGALALVIPESRISSSTYRSHRWWDDPERF